MIKRKIVQPSGESPEFPYTPDKLKKIGLKGSPAHTVPCNFHDVPWPYDTQRK